MEWLVLLVVPVYYLFMHFCLVMSKRAALKDQARAVLTEQYWHDDWNRGFVALGGEPVLTEDEAKAKEAEAAPKALSSTTPNGGSKDVYRKAVWKDHDGEVIRTWQGDSIRVTYGPQNPTRKPLKCDLCGLPHRTEICDEYDLWEDDDDE